MNLDVKALHFTMREDGRDYIIRKLGRIHNAEANIIDLLITISKDGKEFIAEATINFRWGVSAHIKEHAEDFNPAIDKLIDALSVKSTKEKEKAHEYRS